MDAIFDYIDRNRQSALNFTKKLVSIPTVNPPGACYGKCVDALEKKCEAIGLSTRRIKTPDRLLNRFNIDTKYPRINLIAHWQLNKKKTLHFNAHYDVVPPSSNWSVRPFNPVIKNNRLYGRGTEDMKATLCAMLLAVEAVIKTKSRPKVNTELSFVPDEETGGLTGLGYLVDNNLVTADFAIGEGPSSNYFSFGNKGMLWFEVTVLGRSAHASEPYKGVNSFENMVRIVNNLLLLKNKTSRIKTRFTTETKNDQYASLVLGGRIWGGNKTNIVPDNSTFTIDRRVLPEEDINKVKAEIISVLHKAEKYDKDIKLKIKITAEQKPVFISRQERLLRIFRQAIVLTGKSNAKGIIIPGGTDIRFFIKKGIPAVGYSVHGKHRAHGDDEFVYVESILDSAKVFAYVLMNLE